jgi:predicted nucleotidyltransferase
MNANGLQEAIENTVMIDIGQCTVPVASLPVLVLLKLFAYEDCKELKHIKDILRCFIFYEKERRFDLLADEVQGLTYENAGAFVLGKDLRAIITGKQANLVRAVISEIENKPLLGEDEMELFIFFMSGLS